MNATSFILSIASLMLLSGLNGYVVEETEDKMESKDVTMMPEQDPDAMLPTKPDVCEDPDAECAWVGTAPICIAHCSKGWETCKIDPCADGTQHCCVTGTKYYCCRK